MMTFKIIKMTGMSPLHVGAGRDTYDVTAGLPASDALSAALAAMRVMRGDTADVGSWLASFAISGTFPFATIDDVECFFLPVPRGRLAVTVKGAQEHEYRKLLKKVDFAAIKVWQQLIQGKTVEVVSQQLQGRFLLDNPVHGFEPPFSNATTTRVAVTIDEDSKPFNFSWTHFRKGAGLYCIVEADEVVFEELKTLFIELGEQGFGSDRTVGGGHFGVETGTLSIDEPQEHKYKLLLSNYIPMESEIEQIDFSHSTYSVFRRGGFVAGSEIDGVRHLRRNVVNMIAVGSVLATSSSLSGEIVNLSPQAVPHPVWRSGKPICVNIKTGKEDLLL